MGRKDKIITERKEIDGWKGMLLIMPIALAVFPIPLAFPFMLVMLSFEHIENLPITVFYFLWLIVSIIIIYRVEKGGGWVG